MASAPKVTVFLDLPQGASRSALRAGLMAANLPPTDMPANDELRRDILSGLAEQTNTVVFIDISRGDGNRPGIFALDALIPEGHCRQRVFLTRLERDHVSLADRLWVQSLGFADLIAELSSVDNEGSLWPALKRISTLFSLPPIEPAELARYLKIVPEDNQNTSPRQQLRQVTGLSAEALAQKLSTTLDIRDRSYHFKPYPLCLEGAEATRAISQQFDCSSEQAVAIGQSLGALGLLAHVAHEHDFSNSKLFFRLAISDAADRLHLGKVYAEITTSKSFAVADRTYLGKVYPECWVGSEAVDWLVRRCKLARQDAWIVLQRLEQFGLLAHVTQDHGIKDSTYFYRFMKQTEQRV
jgi:hypothetical protein